MTANKRIFLNVVATYGRSLYALIIGLFCGRWMLMALGEVDYGLMGLVGGIIGFVTFFNGMMATAVGRFFAFSVGESQKLGFGIEGLENCRKWFNTALLLHTIIPASLTVVGYPIGVWAINNYLVIPADRIDACIWVWRFSCLAGFVGMVNVPFIAMYNAKQEIAELTIYSFVTTTLNAIFLYYVITHPGFWLVKISAWTCFLGVVPNILICTFAVINFKECRIVPKYFWSMERMRELFIYAGGRFICALAQMLSSQGLPVVVNKILGPTKNAAMTVGNTVVGHASNLTAACIGAMYPAITNAAGRGDLDEMRALSYRMCKLATFATMVFAVPLIIEIDNIMVLWLKTPPVGAASLCAIILIASILNQLAEGLCIAIFAMGKVAMFNVCESIGFFLGFGVAVALIIVGFGLDAVGYGVMIGYVYSMVVKQVLGKKLCGFSIWHWIKHIFVPLIVAAIFSLAIGCLPRIWMNPTLLRVVVTTLLSEVILIAFTWAMVFEKDEKEFVINQLKKQFGKFLCQSSQ